MSYDDQTRTCRDCGNSFVFTAGEQAFYAEKGFTTPPTRCPDCRRARKNTATNSSASSPRAGNASGVRTEVVCANCGKMTTVPFVPRGDTPVYCRECWQEKRA